MQNNSTSCSMLITQCLIFFNETENTHLVCDKTQKTMINKFTPIQKYRLHAPANVKFQ